MLCQAVRQFIPRRIPMCLDMLCVHSPRLACGGDDRSNDVLEDPRASESQLQVGSCYRIGAVWAKADADVIGHRKGKEARPDDGHQLGIGGIQGDGEGCRCTPLQRVAGHPADEEIAAELADDGEGPTRTITSRAICVDVESLHAASPAPRN